MEVLAGAFLFFWVGFILGKAVFQEKKNGKPEERTEETEGKDFFVLRNGFGVTKEKNPNFAEQLVNVLNYSGEDQMEVNYEET